MQRFLYKNLLEWKTSKHRKPLLLQGARQTGKTWLVTEFGKKEYSQFVYLNFEEMPDLVQLFKEGLSPDKIIENLPIKPRTAYSRCFYCSYFYCSSSYAPNKESERF